MTQIEKDVVLKIVDIMCISPDHGNAVMDILGIDKYREILEKYHDLKNEESN